MVNQNREVKHPSPQQNKKYTRVTPGVKSARDGSTSSPCISSTQGGQDRSRWRGFRTGSSVPFSFSLLPTRNAWSSWWGSRRINLHYNIFWTNYNEADVDWISWSLSTTLFSWRKIYLTSCIYIKDNNVLYLVKYNRKLALLLV